MGSVNIFLGGTGKEVAQDIQDSRDFYKLAISEPVAFDLNATTRDGVQLSLVVPDADIADAVAAMAGDWATSEPGTGVGPAAGGTPGARVSPEHALLVDIGKGIAANPEPSAGLYALRAHGLAVFSMLFDPAKAMAGMGPGNEFRNQVANRVASQTFDGRPPRINLVTSTAGGTGAGTVIPLAMWLREQYAECELNLVAVTPSAFSRVLSGNSNLEELAAKGRSGTYSMLRELSLLSSAPDPQTRFAPRRLPVTDRGLAYSPGQQDRRLFERVYWFGGRGGPPRDAFEEAGELVRLLSHDQSASDLAAETGARPMQWVGAVTSIEYPKLRYQRRMVSMVLQEAYRKLREAPPGFEGADRRVTMLLDYADAQTTRPLGAWIHGQRDSALAADGRATAVDAGAADDLARRIRDQADAGTPYRDLVSFGTAVAGQNYESDTPGWRSYVGTLSADIRRRAEDRQDRMQQVIREMRRDEERAFGSWLQDGVLERRLSGETLEPTRDVISALEGIEAQASELQSHVGQDRLLTGEPTLDECDAAIRDAHDGLDNPPPAAAEPSAGDRIWALAVGAFAFLAVLGVARLIPRFDIGAVESDWIAWAVALVAMFAAYRGARVWLLRGKAEAASGPVRRRRAEEALFRAYEDRDRVRALRWMHQELRGRDGQAPFFRELREQAEAARRAVERLAEVYEALEDKATADVSQAETSPPHVVAEVGDCIIADPDAAGTIADELRRRVLIDVQATREPRVRELTLRLSHADEDDDEYFEPAAGESGLLLRALQAAEGVGMRDAQRVESRWRESVWNLVNWKLGENLPQNFGEALLRCEGDQAAATQSLATKLGGLQLPREPSVRLATAAALPTLRRVYVGSAAIEGEYNLARQQPELGAVTTALSAYDGPRVVPALGEQIVFLDLWVDPGDQDWAPGVIGSATEASAAQRTYYGAEPGAPAVATAAETCFTVIPELLAATKLELGGIVNPLAPAVIARLLGCDLDTRGPTYAELFYLLRARGLMTRQREGEGPDAREVTSISADGDAGGPALVSWPVGGLSDNVFGAGRSEVAAFDAFCEFMRFDGTPLVAGGAETGWGYGGAHLFTSDWARNPAGVAALQRAAVLAWYEGDVDDDCTAMLRLLHDDLELMSTGNASARESWERAMERLLAGEERRNIRRTLLNPA